MYMHTQNEIWKKIAWRKSKQLSRNCFLSVVNWTLGFTCPANTFREFYSQWRGLSSTLLNSSSHLFIKVQIIDTVEIIQRVYNWCQNWRICLHLWVEDLLGFTNWIRFIIGWAELSDESVIGRNCFHSKLSKKKYRYKISKT